MVAPGCSQVFCLFVASTLRVAWDVRSGRGDIRMRGLVLNDVLNEDRCFIGCHSGCRPFGPGRW